MTPILYVVCAFAFALFAFFVWALCKAAAMGNAIGGDWQDPREITDEEVERRR